MAYLPTVLAVRADALTFGARRFSQLVIGASRDGPLWRANVDAAELNGYLEYRQPQDAATTVNGAGRVYVRLARLDPGNRHRQRGGTTARCRACQCSCP